MIQGKCAVTCVATMMGVIALGLCGPARADNADQRQTQVASISARQAVGAAAWRGEAFDGRNTASGERYDMYRLTAASADLPLGSYAEVTNLATGDAVVVRINDRAPAGGAAVITLSYAAAHRLGVDASAPAQVRVSWMGAQPRVSRSVAERRDGRAGLTLAAMGESLIGDLFETSRREGLRGLLRGRQHRALVVTWAEVVPTPIAGL
jgi:hypothetical protein